MQCIYIGTLHGLDAGVSLLVAGPWSEHEAVSLGSSWPGMPMNAKSHHQDDFFLKMIGPLIQPLFLPIGLPRKGALTSETP